MTSQATLDNQDEFGDDVADGVEETVRDRPWLETLAKVGWVAKGIVYMLMGATATQIARQESSDDDASPSGALNRVMEQPGGRVLLGVLAAGLILYSLWRVLSVAVIRGHELSAWADRIGYTFSAAFYAALAYAAIRAVQAGREPGRDSTVERLSRRAMESTLGRGAVLAAGLITVAVGLYFIVGKAIRRSFVDDLRGVERGDEQMTDRALVVAGVVGWIGRGVVTVFVGFFVTRAAIRFDPDEARGFDAALREVATSDRGTWIVWAVSVGLVLYGAFCLFSHQRRMLRDHS
ncbi:MAG: DUF1206 domain-containing protein [Ilumatobacter sp.]|nr:DUF1206 domain-containing protein [Ilumatobacter sp.]